ncbi:MAG: hypothetical protein MZU97_01030 [Bacillus subtilis]|nr:hypothetical protein [Bacillus subtilis]
MKKLRLIGLTALCGFGLAACSMTTSTTAATTPTTSSSTTSTSTSTATTTSTTTTTQSSLTTTERGDETMNIHLDFDLTGITFSTPTAPIDLHSLIADRAVFQQNKPIRIFGIATPGTIVLVKLTKDYETQTQRKNYGFADESGRFLIELPALEASFSTYTLTVSDTQNEVRVVD